MESNLYNIDRFLIPNSHHIKSPTYRGEQQVIFNHLAYILSEYIQMNQDKVQKYLLKAILEWERIQGVSFASMRLVSIQKKIEVVKQVFDILQSEMISTMGEPSVTSQLDEGIREVLKYYERNFADREFYH